MDNKDNNWQAMLNQMDSVPKLKKVIVSQKETIALLESQLKNEKLKNKNLERLATTRNGKIIED